jgi:hypothetical protein
MEENKAPMPAGELKKEFVDDMPHKFKKQLGKSIATGLTGFIAGAIVTGVVLIPWMYFLGKLCPSGLNRADNQPPAQVQSVPETPAP